MSDFEETKSFGTKVYPVEASITSSLLQRCEPLLTPKFLISRYLKVNKEEIADLYSPDELKDQIMMAMNDFETMTNIPVQKIQYRERIPFDRASYKAFVFIKLNNGPVLSVEEILIESSNGENIYRLPPDWLEMGFAHKRQINLIPILSIFGAAGLKDGQASNAGLIFLQAVNNFRWLPAFYTVKYTAGLSHTEGQVPNIVNQIIGMNTAIELLSALQVRFRNTSQSIAQDSISQSATGPGPATYKQRIDDLTEKRDRLMKKFKAEMHQRYFLSNI